MAQLNETNTTESNEQNINTKDFVIGALIGGIIGATTALFLAPKSGKELRSDLNTQATTLKEKSGQWKDSAVEKGNEWAAVAKEKTSAISQAVQSNELVNKVKNFRSAEQPAGELENHPEESSASVDELNQKLEDTKKAFDETEKNVTQ
ncbi:YtxH domain-containing protein [Falsibacillus albus]|uniref:YtxH domain-containing protein n=1 Tax=Falsibacillus albus TaxID=2478915 RepID=A0A3L7K4A4_9BACI|nr:YtxH domain-containing protein [Falsibacillus albus]RLQ97907.1 YtxH domain-containing protein [Falsibacillus albus]